MHLHLRGGISGLIAYIAFDFARRFVAMRGQAPSVILRACGNPEGLGVGNRVMVTIAESWCDAILQRSVARIANAQRDWMRHHSEQVCY